MSNPTAQDRRHVSFRYLPLGVPPNGSTAGKCIKAGGGNGAQVHQCYQQMNLDILGFLSLMLPSAAYSCIS